jgi:hypothetical protein
MAFDNLVSGNAGDFAHQITRLDPQDRQKSLEKYAPDLDCIRLSRELRRGTVDDEGKRLLTRLPTDRERRLLQDRLNYLQAALIPAQAAECANEIARLLAGYLSAKSPDPQMTIAQYAHHLHDLPLWAIRRACEPGACSYLDGYNPAFAPSAEQLFIVAKAEFAKAQRERIELEEILAGQIEQQRRRPTKEDLEAKLGRPLPNFPRGDGGHMQRGAQHNLPHGDGGHMRRVLADIDARKTAGKRGQQVASNDSDLAGRLTEDVSEQPSVGEFGGEPPRTSGRKSCAN